MKLRVLGCSGAESPGHNTSAFLLDDTLLLDAGTVGAALTLPEQEGLRFVCLTHSHMDHVKGLPFLADNLVAAGAPEPVTVAALPETLDALRRHLLNGELWPDFTQLPTPENPVLRYQELEAGKTVRLGDFLVTPVPVHHAVPATGYVVERDGKRLAYTGDTGPTEAIWKAAAGADALVVEVSFPDRLEEIALMSGHLTPRLLGMELRKMTLLPKRLLITHLKPRDGEELVRQVEKLQIPSLEFLREGETYDV